MSADARLGLLYLGSRPARRFAEVARRAEQAGFDIFWIPDERFFREVYSLCVAVAGATERIQVGPCVTDPYTRHPALTAMAIATLDELSDGRAVLGLGAGISGFAELALPQPRPARAVAEAIALIRRLLTGQPVEMEGAVLRFAGKLDFTPPRADVAVYVAAAGPRMLEMTGATADGVIIEGCVAPGTLEGALVHVDGGLSRSGRDRAALDVAARVDVALGESIDRAYDALRPRIARTLCAFAPGFQRFTNRGIDVPPELRRLAADVGYTHDRVALTPVAAALTPTMIDAFAIAATPDTLPAHLDRLVARGATQLLINPIPVEGDLVEPVIECVGAWRRS